MRARALDDTNTDSYNPTELVSNPFVSAEGMSYQYPGGRRALWDVSFSWPHQGVVALMGPNGAGKSTLLSMIVGLREPTSGLLTNNAPTVGFLPQSASWPKRFTVEELLTYSAWWRRIPKSERPTRVQEAASALDVEAVLHERVGSLSGGYLRRVMVAQTIIDGPSLVMLDEPSAGLDPRQRVRLRQQVGELAKGCLVVIATHLVEDVDDIATHVTIISDGEAVVDKPITDIAKSETSAGQSMLEQLYLSSVSE